MADAFLTEAALWGQRLSVRTRPVALAAAGHRNAKDRIDIMHFRRRSRYRTVNLQTLIRERQTDTFILFTKKYTGK